MPASTHPAECSAPPLRSILRPQDPRPAGSTRKNSGVGDYYAPSNQAKSRRGCPYLQQGSPRTHRDNTDSAGAADETRRGARVPPRYGLHNGRSPWWAFTLLSHFLESLFGMLDGAVSSYSLPLAPYPFFSFHTSSVQPPGSRVRSSSSILSSSLLFS